jgi:excinuclease ABC subunit C
MKNIKEDIKRIPCSPGIYLFREEDGSILYIGKAKNLKKRVSSYFTKTVKDPRIELLISQIVSIDYIVLKSEEEALLLEDKFVKEYQPKYNIDLKDDKRYPLLKITINETWPRIQVVRKREDDGALYFGPYTDSGAMRRVSKFIRKTFRIISCKTKIINLQKQKHCLYYHLGECIGPDLSKMSPTEYQEKVTDVCLLLSGKGDELLKKLRSKMFYVSRHKNYEKAAKIRDMIYDLENIIGKKVRKDILKGAFYKPADIKKEISELQNVLRMSVLPLWIDAFDISNLFGQDAAGSLIVFRNGMSYKNGYRRFKIKTVTGISDYAMINEIVSRRYSRLKKEKGKMPDLIVVDGGIGQFNTVKDVLEKLGLGNIRVIGLAKRLEEIYTPEVVRLPKDSGALKLLMRVRDEAHRFAILYHRKLRSRRVINSE